VKKEGKRVKMHPEFLKLGSFVIYWYGVLIAAAVFICSLIVQNNAARRGYSPELMSRIVFWTILWGIIGGRSLHVLVQAPYYYRHPLEILSLRNGGLAVEGAVIAALAFLCIYSEIRRFNLLEMLDIVALPVPLGQALGRLGCFMNGCCYGKPTDSFLGVKFPQLAEKVHPTQLYYSITYVLLFFVLRMLYRRRLKPGVVFSTYILGFALTRYIIDMLRGDLLATEFGLYPTQIIGVVLFIMGTISLLSVLGKRDKS